ncbi:hypothetical protein [Altericista sp. CCNU0014]|uniref:hypothetical protein n=1 Tax=Altericista sp. CCNU0014 TaxID=3082949 RepID=UPI00384C9C84
MTEVRNLESIAEIAPTLSQRLASRFLRRWWVTAFALSGFALGAGTLGIFLLLRQPPPPQCERVFWPFASASLRISCAQEHAQKRTLEDLFEAIALVDILPQNHPLRPLIDRWVEIWAKQALDLAETEFHEGQLERAIYFAKKIPAQTTAHAQVKARIQYWQVVWAKGDKVFKQAEAALNDEDWRKAFGIMVGLLSVDNRYWSQTQYEFLNQKIIDAQQDETKLAKAQRLFEAGGIDNLTKALDWVQELSEGTIFKKSIKKLVAKIGQSLVDIAEAALGRQDLTTALRALEKIPQEVSFWPEVQDWTDIANAMSDTWSGTMEGYEKAIAELKKLSPQRPLYLKAQEYIQKWSADKFYVRLLEEARAKVADGTAPSLTMAIEQARQIPSDSTQWKIAQQEIEQWSISLSNQLDQPILDSADELSMRGDSASLQAAIRKAQQIGSGTPLYAEAQSRIKDWSNQLGRSTYRDSDRDTYGDTFKTAQSGEPPSTAGPTERETRTLLQEAERMAQKSTPAALASAIETASQISARSSLHAEAQQSIAAWGDRMLELAASKANYDLESAIAIAQQIPIAAPAYGAAQQQIQVWQQAPQPEPQAQPSPP